MRRERAGAGHTKGDEEKGKNAGECGEGAVGRETEKEKITLQDRDRERARGRRQKKKGQQLQRTRQR